MNRVRTIVLDNEAVQAMLDVRHRKHRRMLAVLEAAVARRKRPTGAVRVVVPTTVRVEAGWDRGASAASVVNRLRVVDAPLDRDSADHAAAIRNALAVSVTDAHVAAVVAYAGEPVAVVTSDVDDLRRIGAHLNVAITVVPL